jgi:hypothetical protein
MPGTGYLVKSPVFAFRRRAKTMVYKDTSSLLASVFDYRSVVTRRVISACNHSFDERGAPILTFVATLAMFGH